MSILKNIIGIFGSILKTNVTTLIISVISIVVIYVVRRFINEKFKKKLPAPIPIELIVVRKKTSLIYTFYLLNYLAANLKTTLNRLLLPL